jgi:ceramide glucosyltransferase
METYLIAELQWLAAALVAASLAGAVYLLAAASAVRRFTRREQRRASEAPPPVSVLKPVYGADADLYDCLKSFCLQDYPTYQVVFGARDATDPAVAVVQRLIAELPERDLALVIDGRLYGTNRKVSNLINMLPAARYGHLVIADSDMRVGPDYLHQVVPPLLDHQVGLVTCLYAGRPTDGHWSRLGALFINHGFLPGVLVGRWLGTRSGCFGATIAIARDTLEACGGFEALRSTLADDYALGEAVRRLGRNIVLSPYIVDAVVHEPDYDALFQHELRWGRTIRTITPTRFAASAVVHAVPLAMGAVLFSGGGTASLTALAIAAAARVRLGRAAEQALALERSPLWLMAIRDGLSFVVLVASFCGKRVTWRGHALRVSADGTLRADGEATR